MSQQTPRSDRIRNVTSAEWIALYAAIVATVSVVWQIWTRWIERRPKLRVRASFIWFLPTRKAVEEVQRDLSALFNQWRLEAQVLNLGRTAAHVDRFSFEARRGTDSVTHWTSPSWKLPWVLEPGEERTVDVTDADVSEVLPGHRLVARAVTTGGDEFRSDPMELEPGAVDPRVIVSMHYPTAMEMMERTGKEVFVLTVEEFERDDSPPG